MSWTEPNAQQYPAHESDPVARTLDSIQRVAQQVRSSTSNLLRTAGIFISTTGMRIESALTVNGDLNSTGNTDIDGTLNVDANATFGGSVTTTGAMTVGGTMNVSGDATFSGNLAVPNGSITNSALSNPVTSAVANPGTGSGFATSPSYATKASTSIPVPAGYSQALVFATGSVTFQDTAPNRFDTRVGIAGGYGAGLPNLANTVGSTCEAHTRTLTGLAGGAITLEVQCLSAAASGGQAANTATVTGFAIFFR